jgi:hypothetical protein
VLSAVFILSAVLALAACGSSTHRPARVASAPDPPLLIPWSRVGDIALGASKSKVEHEYGAEGHGFHVVQHYDAPAGGMAVEGYYNLHGGSVAVTFYDSTVGRIGFGIPYYRTKSGFGVGSRIPLGPCHRLAHYACEHRWHGFIFTPKYHDSPCHCWIKVGLQRQSLPATVATFGKQPWFFIYTSHGRVTGFYFALDFID